MSESKSTISTDCFPFIAVCLIAFFVAKFALHCDISYWWLIAPLALYFTIFVLYMLFILLFFGGMTAVMTKLFKDLENDK